MAILEALLGLAAVLGLLYLYLTWHFKHWEQYEVLYPKPTLLFGNIMKPMLMQKTIGEVLTDIYNAYPNEKVVGWFNLRRPGLLIRDPEIIHKILVTDFHSFRNNDLDIDETSDPILGKNIFALKDEEWKRSRALISPAFTTGKIKPVFPQMVAVAKDLVEYLKKHPEELHIKHLMSRYTTEIVAKCALGIDAFCFTEDKPVMHEMGKLVFEPDPIKGFKMMAFFVMPYITKLFKIKIIPTEVTDFFNSVLRDVIVYRQDKDIQRNDLVQYLIDVKRKTIEVEKGNIQSDVVTRTYTDEDVLAGCIMFFVEGYETSSVILTNILYELAQHPRVQDKLRLEVDEVLKKGELTFETVQDMNYLSSVVTETNRVLPAGIHLQKRCTERYTLDIGKSKPLVIEKGTPIILPLYGLHNDPKYWQDAEEFRPERFTNKEDVNAKAKGFFLPFGDGPRMCIGVRIATTLIKVALIHIVSEFKVMPTARTPKKIEPDPNYFMLAHKGGMFLRFEPRTR